eukprot:4428304-Ditylum_brightwellii.AAC.1
MRSAKKFKFQNLTTSSPSTRSSAMANQCATSNAVKTRSNGATTMAKSTTTTVLVLSIAINSLVFCKKCWQMAVHGHDDENNKGEEGRMQSISEVAFHFKEGYLLVIVVLHQLLNVFPSYFNYVHEMENQLKNHFTCAPIVSDTTGSGAAAAARLTALSMPPSSVKKEKGQQGKSDLSSTCEDEIGKKGWPGSLTAPSSPSHFILSITCGGSVRNNCLKRRNTILYLNTPQHPNCEAVVDIHGKKWHSCE